MDKYIDECAQVFLEQQGKLFDEPVVFDPEEAKEFLEDCFAQVFENIGEVREYLKEEGMDVDDMSDEELEEQLEVFKLENGYYFVVEA
ncbi:MAG: glyoxalase [Lachnospira sp.]